jgi:hypothetical protein
MRCKLMFGLPDTVGALACFRILHGRSLLGCLRISAVAESSFSATKRSSTTYSFKTTQAPKIRTVDHHYRKRNGAVEPVCAIISTVSHLDRGACWLVWPASAEVQRWSQG